MRRLAWLLLWIASSARADGPAPDPPPAEEPRRVLALFDSLGRDDDLDTEDPVHQMLALPLNHLGMVVRRWDIRRGPPPEAWTAGLRAVLTAFDATSGCPDWLWPWLEERAAGDAPRFVHIGEFGPLEDDPERLARWLARFGLAWDAGFVGGPIGVDVALHAGEHVRFETDARRFASHRGPRVPGARNRVWLSTATWKAPDEARAGVVTGPWGGLALAPWTWTGSASNDDRRWVLDPFAFLAAALATDGVPVPHPSVLNGRRMFVFHVDGDGFESESTVEPGRSAAHVFLARVVRRYRIPVTFSIIVAGLTGDLTPDEPTDRMRLARTIFAEPNVEPASHTVLHPLRWDRDTYWYERMRRFDRSPVREVTDSIAFINRYLVDEANPCRMMLWSGECNPPPEAVAAAYEAGCGNLNGGVFRWDAASDSVGFVSPWGVWRGDFWQCYAGAANENDFDGFYGTMPGAFAHIDTTIERCGSPRILKPANVYCHVYSAERPARLAALEGLLDRWAVREPTAPVFASRYFDAVHDAVTGARVERLGDGRWRLTGFGACRTVRLDGEPRAVDFAASRGVVGAHRIDGQLYVALGGPDATLVLAADPAPRPHLEQANHDVTGAELVADAIAWTAGGFGDREAVVAGLEPDRACTVRIGDETRTPRAGADGRLTLAWRQDGPLRVQVR